MMTRRCLSLGKFLLFGLVVSLLLVAQGGVSAEETSLDHYVAQPDDSYRWELVGKYPGQGATTYVLDMTSQTWRTPDEVDRTEWQHWLTVVVPDEVQYDKALLLIGGGANGGEAPQSTDRSANFMAISTGSVVAELKMIPNQPLTFHNDGKPRQEDDLIAYTWAKFMETGDATWPARLPMVKSAVRAMDTMQTFCASPAAGQHAIKEFVVAGGSKRGWTTWLTAAVDDRVAAIIPIVIDVLNVAPSMRHHRAAYGFWAPAVGDYVRHKIVDKDGTPEYAELLRIVDPFSYRDRLTMPKYIVNAAGDEFFLPDSSQFYFNELKGEKYLRYVPNAKHSLSGSDAPMSIQAFYLSVLKDTPRPKFRWTFPSPETIRVEATDRPRKVRLWQATNPKARDFRLDTLGPAYESSELSEQEPGVYVTKMTAPPAGWTAFFIELTYDSGGANPWKFTTDVRVVPDTLPHAGESPGEKAGS